MTMIMAVECEGYGPDMVSREFNPASMFCVCQRFIVTLIHGFQRKSRHSSSQRTWITGNNRGRSNGLQD